MGLSYYKLGRNAEALAAFTAEHTRKPQDFTTIYYLGLLHEAEGNLGDAKRFADLALTMQPASVEVLTVLGKILTRQGKNIEAAGMLEKALAHDPKTP